MSNKQSYLIKIIDLGSLALLIFFAVYFFINFVIFVKEWNKRTNLYKTYFLSTFINCIVNTLLAGLNSINYLGSRGEIYTLMMGVANLYASTISNSFSIKDPNKIIKKKPGSNPEFTDRIGLRGGLPREEDILVNGKRVPKLPLKSLNDQKKNRKGLKPNELDLKLKKEQAPQDNQTFKENSQDDTGSKQISNSLSKYYEGDFFSSFNSKNQSNIDMSNLDSDRLDQDRGLERNSPIEEKEEAEMD